MDPIRYRSTSELSELVKRDQKALKSFLQSLRKKKPIVVDEAFHTLHNKAFSTFDCLNCANCCSNISPIVTEKDVEKLAKHLRMKPSAFVSQYLYTDEDNDYVFKQTPCPFLLPDKYCMVYENRPKACREYPHTDHRKMVQILNLTLKNCEICPVVYEIVNEIRKENKF
jgi:uncharacterized protein